MGQGTRRFQLRFLLANRRATIGVVVLTLGVLVALWPSLLSPQDPLAQEVSQRLQPPGTLSVSGVHLLGTDALGRDVLSRILYGCRVSLLIGVLAVCIAVPLGVTLGLLSGYFGGRFDNLVMRVADVQLALPTVLLAVTFVSVLGRSIGILVLVLGISGWVLYARIVRSSVMALRAVEYLEAARATGARDGWIILRHVVPNVVSPVIVLATFQVAQVILLESTLSFLGLGVQPPMPSWGSMLSDSRDYITFAWWLGVFPGLAIMIVVLSINFVGDWVRDALDPRLQML